MPCRQEARQRRRLHRLHLASQACQEATAQLSQNLGIAPLALGTPGPELAAQDRARGQQTFQRVVHDPPPGSPQRRAGSIERNGPWVRAQRATSPSSAPEAGPRNADGTPAGG